ncbi:cupin domain-containing protein [Curvivirga sp.]|uniref:cupin domain-containing protein n=1 Tax=Curvivirga sp. TaxID=2856848 RepID=UPI003B58F702
MSGAISLQGKLAQFADHWSPKRIAQVNDFDVKIVKIEGEFTWHKHDDEDELFLVVDGEMTIQYQDREDVTLKAGELHVIPKGVLHCPIAKSECSVLLLEKSGVVNTGDAEQSDLTNAVEDI